MLPDQFKFYHKDREEQVYEAKRTELIYDVRWKSNTNNNYYSRDYLYREVMQLVEDGVWIITDWIFVEKHNELNQKEENVEMSIEKKIEDITQEKLNIESEIKNLRFEISKLESKVDYMAYQLGVLGEAQVILNNNKQEDKNDDSNQEQEADWKYAIYIEGRGFWSKDFRWIDDLYFAKLYDTIEEAKDALEDEEEKVVILNKVDGQWKIAEEHLF